MSHHHYTHIVCLSVSVSVSVFFFVFVFICVFAFVYVYVYVIVFVIVFVVVYVLRSGPFLCTHCSPLKGQRKHNMVAELCSGSQV